ALGLEADNNRQSIVDDLPKSSGAESKADRLASTVNEVPVFSELESLAVPQSTYALKNDIEVKDREIKEPPDQGPQIGRILRTLLASARAQPRPLLASTLGEMPVFVESESFYATENSQGVLPLPAQQPSALENPEQEKNASPRDTTQTNESSELTSTLAE